MQNNLNETAVLVGLNLQGNKDQIVSSLKELQGLAETAGVEVADIITQNRSVPHPATFFGKGKIRYIADRSLELKARVIICDQELTPAQLRNLERILEIKVIDRTQLILDIFAQRAQTKEGKLQVELAQLNYLLPRLTGQGGEMSRLGAGIGTRGPGETKLETDRRRIRQRVNDLKKELAEVQKHRQLHRQKRQNVPFPLVSLVGYTNAGKSTLLNALTGSEVLVEDKLFATLDPTTRRVELPTKETILMTDTVGFIQNLPHHLVAAFRATLEEVVEADLLLHVVDASNPYYEDQIKAVEEVLDSLNALTKQKILVYNKVDKVKDVLVGGTEPGNYYSNPVEISAQERKGLKQLLVQISHALSDNRVHGKLFIPFKNTSVISLLHRHGKVLREEYKGNGVEVEFEINKIWERRIKKELEQ
ncbi:MAG: GTPase HflX [Firmicutes bacterium]|nr:GTPase HflX [Bacillota bacterium]